MAKDDTRLPHKVKEEFKPKTDGGKTHVSEISSNDRTSSITCFRCLGKGHIASQCPNKKAMILKDNGDCESIHSSESDDDMPSLVTDSELEIDEAEPVKGEMLVARRALKWNKRKIMTKSIENLSSILDALSRTRYVAWLLIVVVSPMLLVPYLLISWICLL